MARIFDAPEAPFSAFECRFRQKNAGNGISDQKP
jgi:hypothetical protein